MNIYRWTVVTRRRNGDTRVCRYWLQQAAERAYRTAGRSTYMGENPIIEVWLFPAKGNSK